MSLFARGSARAREHFDWPLFLAVVGIAIIGVVNLYSATSPYIDDPRRSGLADMYVQQVYWLVVGGLLGTLAAVVDYRSIERFAYVFYGIGIASLILVLAASYYLVRRAQAGGNQGTFPSGAEQGKLDGAAEASGAP